VVWRKIGRLAFAWNLTVRRTHKVSARQSRVTIRKDEGAS